MRLSKSNYMLGLKCPRHMWMNVNQKSKLPKHSLGTKFLFEQGHIIGALAKKKFHTGIDIPEDKDNLETTKKLLLKRKILFEAGILSNNKYSRADILVPVGKDKWDVIEVKGSTKVKPNHIDDLSFQLQVYLDAGLKIRKCFLLLINPDFRKKGKIDLNKFFIKEDVTDKVLEKSGVAERTEEFLTIINDKKPPQVDVTNDCKNGLKCPAADCWNFLPSGSVFELQRGRTKAIKLTEENIKLLKDIPSNFKLNDKQKIQVNAESKGLHVNKEEVKYFLKKLKEPVHYFDIESYSLAVPSFDGNKPYQQLPFQFVLTVGKERYDFLYQGKDNPQKEFLQELKKAVKKEGSIVVFNETFEIGRLKELAEMFPNEQDWIQDVISRIVDLAKPFSSMFYYDPKFKGKYSLKIVLPILTGKKYSDLNINEGTDASALYYKSIDNFSNQLITDLKLYCGLDTVGMELIVKKLKEVTE